MGRRLRYRIIVGVSILALMVSLLPRVVSGNVQQITEVEDKLEGISEEEKKVLEELFSINQKITDLEKEEENINQDIDILEKQIKSKEADITAKQEDYNKELCILEQVLVNYQRGGPSTYLEILLGAKDFSTFLKSINVIKDISHNISDLLTSLEEGKELLLLEKGLLEEKAVILNEKKLALADNLNKNQELHKEKEAYLASLLEEKAYYSQQLGNLQSMWEECKLLFPKLAEEITNTINEGYFTFDDLNMKLGFLNMDGYIEEDTFNDILVENDKLPPTQFLFEEEQVALIVPGLHLALMGDFIISGETAIEFQVLEGTFYGLPLEQSSIDELFVNGPMLIDFNMVSEGIIAISFTFNVIESKESKLTFQISPNW